MEFAGCPTVCRHCWAQGVGYGAMSLADIEWVLGEAHRFCDGAGLAFDAYPMHEVAAHPDAARLFALFNAHGAAAGGGTMFEPLTTTGVPLAVREDWREVLRADGVAAVLGRALAHGLRADDALWFADLDPLTELVTPHTTGVWPSRGMPADPVKRCGQRTR
jgi:hypothetical protein